MTTAESGTDKDVANWLIKSGDRILGPYSREQIKNMLYDKELVVIDEIITPSGRWRYIRDEPVFAVVVEEVRKSHLSTREDTELGSHEGTAITDTGGTPTAYLETPDTVSVPPTRDVGPAGERGDTTKLSSPQPVRSYSTSTDRRVLETAGQSTRLIWIAAIVIVLGAGFLFMRLQTPSGVAPGAGLTHLAAKAALARSLGDFRTAVSAYEQIDDAGKLPPEMQIDHAVLRARLRDNENPPSRILDGVSLAKLNGTNAAQYETARGLIALNEAQSSEQIKKAASHFSRAVSADRSFAPAVFNSAVTSYLASTYEPLDAKKTARLANEFTRVAEMPSLDKSGRTAAKLMAALVRLRSDQAEQHSQASDDLARLQKETVQYWQEASLLSSYAKLKLGQSSQAARDLRITLGADPFVTDEHLADPYIYTTPLSWSGLKPVCEELHEGITSAGAQLNRKQDGTIDAMLEFCHFKAGDRVDAARAKLKELEAKSITDPLIRSISAYMLMSISPDQARAKLADASDSVSWELGRILRGRLCGPDDLECLNRAFRATAVLRTAIYFKVGSARYSLQKAAELKRNGDNADAKAQSDMAYEILDSVRSISPNYIPLLQVEASQER